MEVFLENIITYSVVAGIIGFVMYFYLKSKRVKTEMNIQKIAKAKEFGLHEPISLHPVIDTESCIGSGACIEACPEEALDIVADDEAAEKRFSNAMDKLPAETERLTEAVKKKDWKPMLAEAEKRAMKVTEKLEALNKKACSKK